VDYLSNDEAPTRLMYVSFNLPEKQVENLLRLIEEAFDEGIHAPQGSVIKSLTQRLYTAVEVDDE